MKRGQEYTEGWRVKEEICGKTHTPSHTFVNRLMHFHRATPALCSEGCGSLGWFGHQNGFVTAAPCYPTQTVLPCLSFKRRLGWVLEIAMPSTKQRLSCSSVDLAHTSTLPSPFICNDFCVDKSTIWLEGMLQVFHRHVMRQTTYRTKDTQALPWWSVGPFADPSPSFPPSLSPSLPLPLPPSLSLPLSLSLSLSSSIKGYMDFNVTQAFFIQS